MLVVNAKLQLGIIEGKSGEKQQENTFLKKEI